MLRVGALSEATIGKPEHDDHSQQGPDQTVGAGLEGAAGVAPENVDINGL